MLVHREALARPVNARALAPHLLENLAAVLLLPLPRALDEAFAPEVVPADEPVPASVEGEFTDGSVEGDVAKPPVGVHGAHVSGYDTNPMFEAATHEPAHELAAPQEMTAPQAGAQESVSEPSTVGYVVGDVRAGLEEPLSADQLSPEAVEKIARRVVELMSDKVVREIAWEVVPELAELLIKQKLDEEKK